MIKTKSKKHNNHLDINVNNIKNLKNKCMFITMFICDASLGMVTPPFIGILIIDIYIYTYM